MRFSRSKYSAEIIISICTVLSVFLMILLNNENAKLRLYEIKKLVSRNNYTSNPVDHTGLILQYYLRMELYRERVDPVKADLIELKALSMFPDIDPEKEYEKNYTEFLVYLDSFVKMILRKKAVISDNMVNIHDLEAAYYYEKNCLYDKAIIKYESFLKSNNMDHLVNGGVLLHMGFCSSMTGDIKTAERRYKDIIHDYSDDEISITASILLRYLENFKSEAEYVRTSMDSPEKAQKLFYMIAFNDSLDVIRKIENSRRKQSDETLLFFKARCLESIGNPAGAMTVYKKLLTSGHRTKFAKAASRRIVIISAKTGDATKYHKEALKNSYLSSNSDIRKLMKESIKPGNLSLEKNYWPSEIVKPEFPIFSEINKPFLSYTLPEEKKYSGHQVSITTDEGEMVKGLVVEENFRSISVDTEYGTIMIRKKNIINIQKK